jgi:hypothetical protein
VRANDLVRNCTACHRNRHHVAARAIDSLAHGLGDFVCLAGGKAHASLAIADGNERVEGEATSALYYLRDTIDRNDVLDELAATFTTAAFAIAAFALTASAATAAALTTFTAATTAALSARTTAASTTTASAAWSAASTAAT